MRIPKNGSGSEAQAAGPVSRPALFRILQRRIQLVGFGLLALLVTLNGVAVFAQEDRPQIIPGERKPKNKRSTGPRAIGVLQMGSNGKTSFIPIAIMISGKFWDASAYKADPVPMALDSGNVYEAERTGNSLGLFTVGGALHRNNLAVGPQPPWIATGTWRPNGTEPSTTAIKAETAPVGLDPGEGPPRLTRDPAKKDKPPDSATPPAGGSSSAPNSAPPSRSSSGSSSSSSDGPPTLKRPASDSGSSDGPPTLKRPPSEAPSSPSADSKPADDSKPAAKTGDTKPGDTKSGDAKAGDSKPDTVSAPKERIPASDSGAREGSRPVLRRGKPEESFADEDIPGYSKVGAKVASGDLSKAPPPASQGDTQLIPAISDAGSQQMRSFVFTWLKGEEDDRRKQMTDLAKEQLRAYVTARAKSMVTATAAKPGAARNAAKPKDPILENVHMSAYDLWGSNQPVIVLSADGHMPPANATQSEMNSGLDYSVMVVAYPDIYNNLHKLYVGVTDKFHLDLTPRLELIDALDADGDGVGELLFSETSDQGFGWVIYRATADKLWKMFDSFQPE